MKAETQEGVAGDQNIGTPSRKLLVPPCLVIPVLLFKSHYYVAGNKPTIIVGDTGVGKSLFIETFKKLYEKEHGEKPVVTINCANYTAQLARSELFGHLKGSFTGATSKKEGLIKKADGGVLILEEIGELDMDIQASLLTVIEDKWYYPVGGDKRENIENITFLAATNNIQSLREDFRQRFLVFEVPPLHLRRLDVLFYIAHMYPEIIKDLSYVDTLEMLAYNWPGNVREVERKCLEIKSREHFFGSVGGLFGKESPRHELRKVAFRPLGRVDYPPKIAIKKLSTIAKPLERYLNLFGVGLSNKDKSFPKFSFYDISQEGQKEIGEEFGFEVRTDYPPFLEAFKGYSVFCSLFFQDPIGNYNTLEVDKYASPEFNLLLLGDLKWDVPAFRETMSIVFWRLSGIRLPEGTKIPFAFKKRIQFFNRLLKVYPSNKFLAALTRRFPADENEVAPDIYQMKYEDAMRHYFQEVLKRSSNRTEAARRIGINYQTLNGKLRKLRIIGKKGNGTEL